MNDDRFYVVIEGVVQSSYNAYYIEVAGVWWENLELFNYRGKFVRVEAQVGSWKVHNSGLMRGISMYLQDPTITVLETPGEE